MQVVFVCVSFEQTKACVKQHVVEITIFVAFYCNNSYFPYNTSYGIHVTIQFSETFCCKHIPKSKRLVFTS